MCKISRRIRCIKPTGSPKIPDFWGKEEPQSVQDVPYSGRRYSGARDDAPAPAKIDKPNYSEILPFTASSDIAPNAYVIERLILLDKIITNEYNVSKKIRK